MEESEVIETTRRWIAGMVIELNLCPFAGRVFEAGAIRYVVSEAEEIKGLREDLAHEACRLAEVPITEIETTLLIHPRAFRDFLDYNDFLDVADETIADLGLEGVIQVASFHPEYQFADTDADAVENYTNRSPFPMLHLLREESVSTAATNPDELLEIPKHNIQLLQSLGREAILERLRTLHERVP